MWKKNSAEILLESWGLRTKDDRYLDLWLWKQEAHGPHRSPEKNFFVINKLEQSYWYMYIAGCLKVAIITFWKRTWLFIWTNINPLKPRMFYAKFGWNCQYWIEKKIFKCYLCIFCYFSIFSPLKKAWPIIWINLKDRIFLIFLKNPISLVK